VTRRRTLGAGLATILAATEAHAHHPGGDGAGPGLWLFTGAALGLAGIAVWAFLSGEPGDAGEAADAGAEPADRLRGPGPDGAR
jgi:hypothetical protein